MVYVRPDIEAGTIQEGADVPPPPLPPHEADETDEEPDVEDIEVDCQVSFDNNFTGHGSSIFKFVEDRNLGGRHFWYFLPYPDILKLKLNFKYLTIVNFV